MKLGNHTIGVRTTEPRLDANGQPVRDELGDPVTDEVDVEVRWCSVVPVTREVETTEPEGRVAPALTGMRLLAPPRAPITANSTVVWPVTAREAPAWDPPEGWDGADPWPGPRLRLSGRVWQVVGEPAPWDESLEARLQAAK